LQLPFLNTLALNSSHPHSLHLVFVPPDTAVVAEIAVVPAEITGLLPLGAGGGGGFCFNDPLLPMDVVAAEEMVLGPTAGRTAGFRNDKEATCSSISLKASFSDFVGEEGLGGLRGMAGGESTIVQ
jgi:hypothetical protein